MDDQDYVPANLLDRVALIPAKLRARGVGWFVTRLREETGRIVRITFSLIAKARRRLVYLILTLDPSAKRLSRGTLFVIYDLEYYPVSFDICWFLVWADIERQRRGLQRVHCVFVPADEDKRKYPDGYNAVVDRISRAWRFNNIIVAAAAFLPSAAGITVCHDRAHAEALELLIKDIFPKISVLAGAPPSLADLRRETIAALTAEGPEWIGLRATAQGIRYIRQWLASHAEGRKPVVITFRQYGVDPERNSNIAEWVAFARTLDPDIYFPVIVPDTDASLDGQPECDDLTVFHPAAWNLGLRMALYECAYINLVVTSGPMELCVLNPLCSYLFFKVEVSSTKLASIETLRQMGFEKNTTPSFATPFQKWVWEDDRRDVIAREFEAMVARIEDDDHIAPANIPKLAEGF